MVMAGMAAPGPGSMMMVVRAVIGVRVNVAWDLLEFPVIRYL